MRIIVMSASHGREDRVDAVVQKHLAEADAFLFLGDVLRDIASIRKRTFHKEWIAVPGNCDFGSDQPPTYLIPFVEGDREVRTLITHGHLFSVKRGMAQLEAEATRRGAQLVLFGHTHLPYTAYRGGIYYLNPGSLGHPRAGAPSYGIVDITAGGIVPHVVEVYP